MTEKSTPMPPAILWFRHDLRLQDHAGVAAALATGAPVLPTFIWDAKAGTRPPGAASRWWLHRSLHVLDEELRKHGSRLIVLRGDTGSVLRHLISETQAKTVICSSSYDPSLESFDARLEKNFAEDGMVLKRYNNTLLMPPGLIKTGEDRPFRVFTPFYKALVSSGFCDVRYMPSHSAAMWPEPVTWPKSLAIDDLGLGDTRTRSGKDWARGFDRFIPGERGARKALRHFLAERLADYAAGRDRPDKDLTSHLSPHLRFGEISLQRILFELARAVDEDQGLAVPAEKFRSELAWREFSYGLLAQHPRLHEENVRGDFDGFPWRDDDAGFRAWTRGETGYDLVDAGMRELWQTGYMHNRVRMVCASFLTKHLLIDWRRGEKWFWDCLLDADPANNPASWQWVAGSGADAAPWFRIFNPLTQAEKFDPSGLYRARYLPEGPRVAVMRHPRDLFESGDEPRISPIVDHAFARQRALDAYQQRTIP